MYPSKCSRRSSSQTTDRSLFLSTDTNSPRSVFRATSTLAHNHHKDMEIRVFPESFRGEWGKLSAGGKSRVHSSTIHTLPDEILLEIFDFCRTDSSAGWTLVRPVLEWHRLAHVCRRWRQIVFSSPRRLDLQLICTYRTPVRKNLRRWPAFPINIDYSPSGSLDSKSLAPYDKSNVIAALGHPDRVRRVRLTVTKLQLKKMATVMQRPFPALTHLWLSSKDSNVPVLDDSFLGGSAPCLEEICISGIPYPALPTLLSSTSDLVVLRLFDIPYNGGIAPEKLVACLAALTKLETLFIEFRGWHLRIQSSPVPPTRSVFPALTTFGTWTTFVAQIDAPRLDDLRIFYIGPLNAQVTQFAQLAQFISRTADLKPARFNEARVEFRGNIVYIVLDGEHGGRSPSHLTVQMSCIGLDRQVSQAARVLCRSSVALADVGRLSICERARLPLWRDGMVVEWLELLRPFAAVETLRVTWWSGWLMAGALERATGEMVAGVLPALHSLYLEDLPAKSFERFIAMRQPVFGS
ncbi:hypothetical protein EDB89DRAFT_1994747 [Lactarius sanguifluus]|nr:hypothetical protein EDB89DRAFT_1994747 [Lactarius sanguifluus]